MSRVIIIDICYFTMLSSEKCIKTTLIGSCDCKIALFFFDYQSFLKRFNSLLYYSRVITPNALQKVQDRRIFVPSVVHFDLYINNKVISVSKIPLVLFFAFIIPRHNSTLHLPPEIHKTIFIMHLARFSEAVLGADGILLLILSQ